ncbi:UbiH/UbiF/VisC/COQ6 family ubiquinone biosynthesis hydroxylase [Parasphingopyxis marina]|uniref:UbiH/UbiF/VisC/COQ6 family ubiquinone biosynthesis hydroxylase n=1 Tax=Parasphingopyxis marina TaxID=2761622 RepID=A0A842HR96_9SPHN|nr:UbiH/UbiF/VisC/COQ6 family ubiquinone biosynthesis hydroxylase [Parasphingopyxis marina]MBC2776308.1 UbiH/UbiF/VisC/COQ6 family ubiquinone biosynthesis hydroxylase [Parasphingopyxis marina]
MATNGIKSSDVIILGGGLVGQTLALALDAHGLSCAVVDRMPAEALLDTSYDGRVSAVASASWKMLQAIGLGEALEGKGCPISTIRVSEGMEPGALDFEPAEDEGPLGIMFENRLLRATLFEAAQKAEHVALYMGRSAADVERGAGGVTVTLDDGTLLSAPLLVGAEGRNSSTREAAGLKIARWRYPHHAIVACLNHEKPHGNIAYEIFYAEGPFAILPMLGDTNGHRSALVWSVPEKDGPATLAMNERAFLAEVHKRMDGFLGEVSLAAPRSAYPLGFHNAAKITADRLALVGDSAHGMHPIAGQGLNVGFRDVAALTQVLVEGARLGMDLGDAQLMERYERWRGLDTLMVAMATDGLTRLFGVPGKTASRIRRFGLGAVGRIPPLKRKFVDEARGSSGKLPLLLQGVTV